MKEHVYSCMIVSDENNNRPQMHTYKSTHRSGSKANEKDAISQWKAKRNGYGWADVVYGSVYRIDM